MARARRVVKTQPGYTIVRGICSRGVACTLLLISIMCLSWVTFRLVSLDCNPTGGLSDGSLRKLGSALDRLHLSRADMMAIPKDVRDRIGLQMPKPVTGQDQMGDIPRPPDEQAQKIPVAAAPQEQLPPASPGQKQTGTHRIATESKGDDIWGDGPQPASPAPAAVPRIANDASPDRAAGKGSVRGAIPASPAPMPPPKTNTAPLTASTGPKRVLLIICYNRPQYLQRTLNRVLQYFPRAPAQQPVVVVSQDGSVSSVSDAAERWQQSLVAKYPTAQFVHWHHQQTHEPGDDGYTKLARHFGWALGRAFAPAGQGDGGAGLGADWVTILEDDLEIAPDFFGYFRAMEGVLTKDDTLMAASAYNDVGQERFVADPRQVLRSDFFPGLGWMLGRRTWTEVGPKWPRGYWDDWLREPAQRKGRAFLRPEVSRTRTFGEKGVSMGQFYRQFLANIKLNDQAVDWDKEDVGYLLKQPFDVSLGQLVAGASEMPPQEATRIQCPAGDARTFKVMYQGLGSNRGGYVGVTAPFHFLSDVKAMVPRTAYRGVVRIRFNGCLLLFVPKGGLGS